MREGIWELLEARRKLLNVPQSSGHRTRHGGGSCKAGSDHGKVVPRKDLQGSRSSAIMIMDSAIMVNKTDASGKTFTHSLFRHMS